MFEFGIDAIYPSVQALGWALVHFCWQGALIAAVFATGSLVLRQAPPAMRYLLGLICMAAMALAPILTFWLVYPQSVSSPAVSSVLNLLPADVAASNWAGSSPGSTLESVLPWVVLLWASGVLLMSGRVFVNWRRMKRLTGVGVIRLSRELQLEVENLCRMFGIKRAVTVLESTIVKVPTVLGWLKPVILLPSSSLLGLSAGQLEMVIAHELGHIRRLDYLVNLFQVSIETALFYHPAVGWVSRHVRDEREKCVDDLVIGHCGNPIEYAKALADLESMRAGFQIAPAIGATDGQLLQRIERIVCDHTARPREAVAGNSMLLLAFAAVVVMASQFSDPMAGLEQGRKQLADTLVSELLIRPADEQSNRALVPLANAPALELEPMSQDPTERRSAVPEQQSEPTGRYLAIDSSPVQQPAADASLMQATRQPVVQSNMQTTVAALADPMVTTQKLPLQAAARTRQLDLPVTIEPQPLSLPARSQSSQPTAITRVSPSYPVRARMAGQEGFVIVEFGIKANGRVAEIRIIDSSPRRVFDKAARTTIRKWRFVPNPMVTSGSKRYTQRFDFSLGSGQDLETGISKGCSPVTGTRICRAASPTSLVSQESYSS